MWQNRKGTGQQSRLISSHLSHFTWRSSGHHRIRCNNTFPPCPALRECPKPMPVRWSESSLGAQSFCWLCHEAAHLSFRFFTMAMHSICILDPDANLLILHMVFVGNVRNLISRAWIYFEFCCQGPSLTDIKEGRQDERLHHTALLKKQGRCCCLFIWATSWGNLILPYANNKGADQPAHPRSLIIIFVVRCLDSIISLVSVSENWSLFESFLVANPEEGFCRDEAHTILSLERADVVFGNPGKNLLT